MTKLAGRCPCGVLERLARGEEHDACRGQRKCRGCAVTKPLGEFPHLKAEAGPRHVCRVCTRAKKAAAYRRRMTPDEAARLREYSRLRMRKVARAGGPAYQRHLAYKRTRYRTDLVYRERENARSRAYRAQRRAA